MNREYYAYWSRLENEESFLIWFSNEKDGFVVDENGFIPSFKTINETETRYGIVGQTARYGLDWLIR